MLIEMIILEMAINLYKLKTNLLKSGNTILLFKWNLPIDIIYSMFDKIVVLTSGCYHSTSVNCCENNHLIATMIELLSRKWLIPKPLNHIYSNLKIHHVSYGLEHEMEESLPWRLDILFIILTHWSRDQMDAISQTIFSNAFSWMKMFQLRLKFHWSLSPRVKLTIFQHWFR